MFKAPEEYRVKTGQLATDASYGNNGFFVFDFEGRQLAVTASDGEGWEHVSVSLENRNPNWREMCLIKNMFWGKEDCVVQYHPPESEYVNNHEYCLHLWRPIGKEIPAPPSILVGIKHHLK